MPKVNKPFGNITVSYCSVAKRQIDVTSYSDTDTGPLEIQFLESTKQLLKDMPRYPLVGYSEADLTIYVVPSTKTVYGNQELVFYIRAINTVTKNFVDEEIWINFIGYEDIPEINYGFQTENKLLLTNVNSQVYYFYQFVENVQEFFGWPINSRVINIYDYEFLSSGGLNIKYQNCTIRETPCDDGANFRIFTKYKGSEGDFAEYKQAMLPIFDALPVTTQSIGVCEIPNNQAIMPWMEYLRIYTIFPEPWYSYISPYPGIFEVNFDQVFTHESGDFVRYELIYGPYDPVPKTYYQFFHTNYTLKTNTLFVQLLDEAYVFIPPPAPPRNTSCNCRMIKNQFSGFDQRNMQGNFRPDIFIYGNFEVPKNYYLVTFHFHSFKTHGWDIRVKHMHYFMNATIRALGEQYRTWIFLKTFYMDAGNATWGLRVFPGCNFTMIRHVQKIMFGSYTDKTVSDSFNTSLSTQFTLTGITETFQGACKIEPPFKKRDLDILQIPLCGIYRYQIPEDTFADNQDGGTRNLTIKLVDNTQKAIADSSWIGFDTKTQTLYANPTSSMLSTSSSQRLFTYKFIVTDSSNQSLVCDFSVQITGGNAPQVAYKITIKSDFDSSTTSNTKSYTLATKVSTWTKSESNFLLLDNQLTSDKQTYLAFSQCSWRYDPCETTKIDQFHDQFFDSSGQPKNDFLNHLGPQFSNIQISSSTSGPCIDDKPPKVVDPWGPFTLSSCLTFNQLVPENTFLDDEEGNARNLKLTLTPMPPRSSFPEWVSFDTATQQITMVPYNALADQTFQFALNAEDSKQQSVSQNLQWTLPSNPEPLSHVVEMSFQVSSAASSTLNTFTLVYSQLRTNVQTYFTNEQSDFVEYSSLVFGSQILTVKWSHCGISRTQCERSRIEAFKDRLVASDGAANSNFKQSLQANFDVISVSVKLQGICIDEESNPIVENPIPDQKIQYCGNLKYEIPENTFSDKIDGGTRDLKLTVEYKGSSTLPDWISFSESSQEFIVFLISSKPAANNITMFDVTATTERGKSVTTNITFVITDTPLPKERKYVKFGLSSQASLSTTSDQTATHQVLISFINKVATVYGFTASRLTVYEYGSQVMSNLQFLSVKVMSCGFQNCSAGQIEKMTRPEFVAFDKQGFQPDFSIMNSDMFVAQTSECQDEIVPPVNLQNLQPFSVRRCTAFEEEITGEIFQDRAGFSNLRFLIMTVNEQPIDPQNSWIAIDGAKITGVVTNAVLKSGFTKYNVTIRAINKHNLHSDTWVEITILGTAPQLFYQYEMTVTEDSSLTQSSQSPGLARQIDMVKRLKQMFTYDIVNVVEYQQMINNKQFNLIWSVCPLPNKCTTEGLSESEKKLIQAGQPTQELITLLQTEYQLNSIQSKDSEACSGPLNPPVPTQDPLEVEVPLCGGFRYQFPSTLFTDEDGDARKLHLWLLTPLGARAGAFHDWLLYIEKDQTIEGVPTYVDGALYNKEKTELKLVATDSTGLTATISFYLTFKMVPQPKYRYQISLSPFNPLKIDDYHTFLNKIGSFGMPELVRKYIGYWSYRTIANGNMIIEFFSCNVTYNPCNLYRLQEIKSEFSDSNNFPTTKFRDHMEPDFNVGLVAGDYEEPCGQSNPPVVIVTPPKQIIYCCGIFQYTIPERTFFDSEQGYTRHLDLSLTSSTFTMTSFTEFSSQSQLLMLIPSASVISDHQSQTFVYQLKATDNTQLFQVTSLTIDILGPYSILHECSIKISMTRLSIASSRTNLQTIQYFIQRLASYFQVTEEEIGVVSYSAQSSSTSVVFIWSYCSSNYRSQAYQTDSSTLKVDYYNLQIKILRLLFDGKRKVQTSFLSVFSSQFSIQNVETQFTGRCRDLPPTPTPGHHEIVIYLSYGGYVTHDYLDNYFYDYEDGDAFSLSLTFLNSQNHTVLIDHWINIDYSLHTIYAIVDDVIRASSSSIFIYYLRATDSASQTAFITITVRRYTTTFVWAPFNITYSLQYTGQSSMVYVRQSHYLINSIIQYFSSITTYVFVLVRGFYQIPGYPQYKTIVFSVARETCSSKVLEKVKTVYSSANGQLDSNLKSSVSQMFTLHRVTYESTCSSNPDPPSPVDPLPDLTVSYCMVFNYNLPSTLFHDTIDGETNHLGLALLDQHGMYVSSSSWFQLNAATMQLYAVAIQSYAQQQSTYTYQIQATNSRGLSNKVSFKARMDGKPFTADCYLSMSFTYKFMTSNVVDIDVLQRFISMVQEYYGRSTSTGKEVKIKMFTRVSNSFNVSWSHCAFQYSSLQLSQQGLTENDRNRITQIFSKYLVTSSTGQISNQIISDFKTFMSSHFTIQSLTASYDCIEEPPVPSIDKLRVFPKFCQLFNESIPITAFHDRRDGNTRNLALTLLDEKGRPVSSDSWLQMDAYQYVYGVVTEDVKKAAPLAGYQYYVQARDSSGRTANISYIVKVASSIKSFDVYFRLGFQSQYGESVPTATLLNTLVQKLSKYIDPDDTIGKIYVKELTFPNSLLFSHCDLSPDCTQEKVASIVQRLTSSAADQATADLKNFMAPEIVPTTVRVDRKHGTCGSINFTIIVTPPPPNPTLPECGSFTYTIPDTLFKDIMNRNTRNFYLKFLTANGEIIPMNSMIRANEPAQIIYGINTITQVSQSMVYTIQATHPTSGNKATSTIIFNTPNYSTVRAVADNLCLVTIEMTSQYNSEYDDVNLVFKFMLAIAQYLSLQPQQLQIYSYTRWGTGFPYYLSVTWTSCSLTSVFIQNPYSNAYYTSFSSILQQIMVLQNGQYTSMTQRIQQHFKTTTLYAITSIRTSNCTKPPTTPPKPSGPMTVTLACGYSKTIIPEDLFTDDPGGNTRQLSLKLLQTNGSAVPDNSWINIDQNQNIIAMLSNDTVLKAVDAKYEFLIEATDKDGKSATTKLTANVPTQPFNPTSITVKILLQARATFESDLVLQGLVASSIDSLLKFGVRVFVSSAIKIAGIYDQLTFDSCQSCGPSSVAGLINLQRNQASLQALLTTQVLIVQINIIEHISKNDVDCQGTAGHVEIDQYIPYCTLFKVDFADIDTVGVYAFDVVFPYSKGKPLPSDSWIWYRNYTLEIYPPPTMWAMNPNTKWEYDYTLVRNSGPNKGQPTNRVLTLQFQIQPEDPIPQTIDFKIVLQESGPRSQFFDNYYISLVMRALSSALGNDGIHFVSFTVLQNTPFKFEIKWQNCSLPKDCESSAIDTINSILYSANLPSLTIRQYLPPNITIIELDSPCKNTPPVIKSYPLNLTVPVCGKYTYHVPDDLAEDPENPSSTLTLSFALANGDPIPQDSWIRFDSSTNNIYAMPTEGIIAFNREWKYLLYFTDSKGSKANLTVNIRVETNANNYYRFIIRFQSLLPSTTPYLDLQLRLLEQISQFTKNRVALDEYRVISFSREGHGTEVFVLIYGDCSVNETICSNEEARLLSMESNMKIPNSNRPQASFKSFLQSTFDVQVITREPSTLTVIQKPIRLNYGVVEINDCESRIIDVRTFFSSTGVINYSLNFGNGGNPVPLSYWTQIQSQTVYIDPSLNINVGRYEFDLEATDTCGNTVTAPFTVNIKSVYSDSTGSNNQIFGYTWLIRIAGMTVDPDVPDVYYLNEIRTRMVTYMNLRSNQYTITIISYERFNDGFQVKFGECSIVYFPCDKNKINDLITVLFPMGSTTAQIQQQFDNYATVTSYTGQREETCGTPVNGPKCPDQLLVNTTFCEIMEFQLPVDFCTDPQDGSVRNLNLQFMTGDGKIVQSDSWIQLDQSKQSIYGYPMYQENMALPTNLTYLLRVADKSNKAAYVTVYVKLYGDRPTMDYKMSFTGSLIQANTRNYIEERLCLARQISKFFNRDDINNIAYTSSGVDLVTFGWTFCKQQKVPCECKVIKTAQDRLRDDYSTFKNEISECRMNVKSTAYRLAGLCQETNGPKVGDRPEETEVNVGQPFSRTLSDDTFTDVEDGFIQNMTLFITDQNDKRLEGATWLQIDEKNKLCGMMAYKDYTQAGYEEVKEVTYKMYAMDNCGKNVSTPFTMELVDNFPALKYRIVFLLERSKGDHDCRKTDNLISTIADYGEVPKEEIYVDDFRDLKANQTNGSLFTWGLLRFTDKMCDGEEFETFREKFVKDGEGNVKFLQRMKSEDHEVRDVYDIVDEECLPAFPWWILILVLLFLLLFLLMWCLWCCIPRCCGRLCLGKCPCCAPCCSKGGKYSSMPGENEEYAGLADEEEDPDLLAKPIPPGLDDPDGGPASRFNTNNKEVIGGGEGDPDQPDSAAILPPNYRVEKDSIDSNPLIDTNGRFLNDLHTESWTDKRDMVFNRFSDTADDDERYERTRFGRDYNDRRYIIDNRRRIDSRPYFIASNPREPYVGGRATDVLLTTSRDVVRYGDSTGANRRLVRYRTGVNDFANTGYTRKIRRSDLREYLSRRGQPYNGDAYLTESDMNELIRIRKMRRQNALPAPRRSNVPQISYLRTDSRLTDALVDRNYVRKYRHSDYDNRRYSTGSLLHADTARGQSFDTGNLRLRIEDKYRRPTNYSSTDDSYYMSSSGDGRNDRVYFVDRNYFRDRYVDSTGGSSSEGFTVENGPTQSIPMYYKRTNGGGLDDSGNGRRVVFRTDKNTGFDDRNRLRGGDMYRLGGGAGGGETVIERRYRSTDGPVTRTNRRTTTSYKNQAYDNYGESSV
ncbi:uncharacterized protein [Clytia hemisphaerica]